MFSPTPTLESESTDHEHCPHQVSALSRRIHGWTWQAFPVGMGTGSVYVTMSGLNARPYGLQYLETAFYFINMALFLLNTSTLLLQAIFYPKKAWRLLTDPTSGIFVPLIVLSFATIIIGTINYAVPAGYVSIEQIYRLFWVYVTFATIASFLMLMIWFNTPHELIQFTPVDAFVVLPLVLVGVIAFSVLKVMDLGDSRCLGILLTGYFFQGIGFFMTFFYICIYIVRLLMTGFLQGHQANGAFVICSPPGFTALALIKLGKAAQTILPNHNLISENSGEIWYAVSVMSGLMLFGLAAFFFVLGALPYWFKVNRRLGDILSFWALTFPNVGWICTIRALGDIFHIRAFFIVHDIMSVTMCGTWVVLFILTTVAFVKGQIFCSNDEDVVKDSALFFHWQDWRKDSKEPTEKSAEVTAV